MFLIILIQYKHSTPSPAPPAPLTAARPLCTLRWQKKKSSNPWGLAKQLSSSSERGILISHCYQRRSSVTASKPSPWTLRWAERHTAADSTQALTIKAVRETQRGIKAERCVCSFWLALERERATACFLHRVGFRDSFTRTQMHGALYSCSNWTNWCDLSQACVREWNSKPRRGDTVILCRSKNRGNGNEDST